MSEILVRVVDKVSDDLELDARLLKRGDVVAVCPDDWKWSERERTNPEWQIVKLPGVAVEDLDHLRAPEPGDPTENRLLQRRWSKIDLDSAELPQAARDGLAAGERGPESVTLTEAQVDAARVVKAPREDPRVIGGDGRTIG